MRRLLALAFLFSACARAQYYPDAAWQHKTPAEVGMDAARLREAVEFAIAAEVKNPRDLTLNHYQTFGREPLRVDMAHSVTSHSIAA